jgi:hypothetical protein
MTEQFKPYAEILKVIKGPFENGDSLPWNLCLTKYKYDDKLYEEEFYYSNMREAMDDVDFLSSNVSIVIDSNGNAQHDDVVREVSGDA